MNRLTEALLRPEPTMAVVVTEPLSDEVIEDVANVADVFEFRADAFPSHDLTDLAREAGRLAALPTLLTIKSPQERGGWKGDVLEKHCLIRNLLPLVDGVDIELGYSYASSVTEEARSMDKTAVVSHHDFKRTPGPSVLGARFNQAWGQGADFVKVATSAKTPKEYQRLADFTSKHRPDGIITVAMDDYGPLSRITLPGLGSRLTYASVGEAVVPGQLNYNEMAGLLEKLYPRE